MADDRNSITNNDSNKSRFEPWKSPSSPSSKGLKMDRHFSTEGVHPFDELEWEKRDARISGDDGEAIFEQKGVEVPLL